MVSEKDPTQVYFIHIFNECMILRGKKKQLYSSKFYEGYLIYFDNFYFYLFFFKEEEIFNQNKKTKNGQRSGKKKHLYNLFCLICRQYYKKK